MKAPIVVVVLLAGGLTAACGGSPTASTPTGTPTLSGTSASTHNAPTTPTPPVGITWTASGNGGYTQTAGTVQLDVRHVPAGTYSVHIIGCLNHAALSPVINGHPNGLQHVTIYDGQPTTVADGDYVVSGLEDISCKWSATLSPL